MAYTSKWQRGILRRGSPGVRIGRDILLLQLLFIYTRLSGIWNTWAEAEPGADQVHLGRGGARGRPGAPVQQGDRKEEGST